MLLEWVFVVNQMKYRTFNEKIGIRDAVLVVVALETTLFTLPSTLE